MNSWSEDTKEDRISISRGSAEPSFGLSKKTELSNGSRPFATKSKLRLTQTNDSLQRLEQTRVIPPTHAEQPKRSSMGPGSNIERLVTENDQRSGSSTLTGDAVPMKQQPLNIVSTSEMPRLIRGLESQSLPMTRHSTGSLETTSSTLTASKRTHPRSHSASNRTHHESESRNAKAPRTISYKKTRESLEQFLLTQGEEFSIKEATEVIINESALRIYLDNHYLSNGEENWRFILDSGENSLQFDVLLDKNSSTGPNRRTQTRHAPSLHKHLLQKFDFDYFESLT